MVKGYFPTQLLQSRLIRSLWDHGAGLRMGARGWTTTVIWIGPILGLMTLESFPNTMILSFYGSMTLWFNGSMNSTLQIYQTSQTYFPDLRLNRSEILCQYYFWTLRGMSFIILQHIFNVKKKNNRKEYVRICTSILLVTECNSPTLAFWGNLFLVLYIYISPLWEYWE